MNAPTPAPVRGIKAVLKYLTRWAGYDGFKRIPTLVAAVDRIVFKISFIMLVGLVAFYLAYRLTE